MNNRFQDRVLLFFKFHPVTGILLSINAVMVFVMLWAGGFTIPNLIRYGAIFPPFITEFGEYYRLLAAMFLHGSLVHFIMNSFVLYYLGGHLERLVGPLRYGILYFFAGLVSSVFVVIFGAANTVTIGASGAIFGIIGGLLMLTFLRPKWFTEGAIRSIRQLMIINLVFTFVVPNISIPGHLGGLLMGMVLFFILLPDKPWFYKKLDQLQSIYQPTKKQHAEDDEDDIFRA